MIEFLHRGSGGDGADDDDVIATTVPNRAIKSGLSRDDKSERKERREETRHCIVGSVTNRRRKKSELDGGVSRGKRCRGCLRVTVTFIGSRYDDASDR